MIKEESFGCINILCHVTNIRSRGWLVT